MPSTYYAEHSVALRRELADTLDSEAVRRLHDKRPLRHFLLLARQFLLLGGAEFLLIVFGWRWFTPLAAGVAGFTIFNFTVLLHEVIHQAVTARDQARPKLARFLSLLYAIPSGISASQFSRWHLDHHAGLGSYEDDPKRHWLSPKINARWLKLAYFTPALLPIYFRAAARENAGYPPELRRKIARERWATVLLQLGVLGLLWTLGGWEIALRAYLIPVFFVFPIAFALNRLGQHYGINPEDPANWATLVKGSWFWDFAFIYSNYHLEHHYFPGVPCYRLPQLQKLLAPLYQRHAIPYRSYGGLFWDYIIRNRAPHTRWETPAEATTPVVA